MKPLQSLILVPTDFSPASVEALAYAVRLGEATGSEVRLLHALPLPAAPRPGSEGAALAEDANATETARTLDELHQLAASESIPCMVRRGRAAAEEIVEEARALEADLIVLGTCGQRPAYTGLGAVSGEVIQTAPCDVLLVPYQEERQGQPVSIRRILIPIDFSGASRPLIQLGRRLAEALGAHIDLVHVLEPLPHPVRWLDETFVDLVPEIQERAGAALRALAEEFGPIPEGMGLYIERGKAAPTIPQVARALGTDLILLGPHAERPVFDKLLGSVAEGVARRTTCPVFIARVSAHPEAGPSTLDTHSYEAVV